MFSGGRPIADTMTMMIINNYTLYILKKYFLQK